MHYAAVTLFELDLIKRDNRGTKHIGKMSNEPVPDICGAAKDAAILTCSLGKIRLAVGQGRVRPLDRLSVFVFSLFWGEDLSSPLPPTAGPWAPTRSVQEVA